MAGSRRARVRRVAKWVGVVLCGLTVVTWAVSIEYSIGFNVVFKRGRREESYAAWAAFGRFAMRRFRGDEGETLDAMRGGWVLRQQAASFVPRRRVLWAPDWHHGAKAGAMATAILLPLWMPFAAFAAPTAFLWYLDRRSRPGHCPCGYSLAGLGPGAPCPECGKAPA